MDFTFVVITYNHEAYVLEHLESIAYQIQQYGRSLEFQLIIADDASADQTLALARHWLQRHENLFADVQIHTQTTNHGTCHNYTKVWSHIRGRRCKLTAGDDVYSCENLLAEWERLEGHDASSGFPLNLVDGQLSWPGFFNANMVATNRVYARSNFMKRLLGISFLHTPSIMFSTKILRDEVIKDFVREFSVTEDYPLHVKMAQRFSPLSFTQSPLIHIYYRRTAGSTYLVRSEAFDRDKLAIFAYLRDNVAVGTERLLMRNRMFCYRLKSRWLRRLLNMNYLVYAAKILLHAPMIALDLLRLNPDLDKHKQYYETLRTRAQELRASFVEIECASIKQP